VASAAMAAEAAFSAAAAQRILGQAQVEAGEAAGAATAAAAAVEAARQRGREACTKAAAAVAAESAQRAHAQAIGLLRTSTRPTLILVLHLLLLLLLLLLHLLRVYVRIQSEGWSRSDFGRILVVNDPPARCSRRCERRWHARWRRQRRQGGYREQALDRSRISSFSSVYSSCLYDRSP